METISNYKRKARKAHECEGCEQITHYDQIDYVSTPPQCAGIKRGDSYQYQFNKVDGQAYDFKSCLPCYEFICKHGLFEDA